MSAQRLVRFGLNAADPDGLAAFYEAGFGFVRESKGAWPTQAAARLFDRDIDDARVVGLRLGDQRLDLVGLVPRGAPYPGDVPGYSPLFQHLAIIVSDMEAAYERLSRVDGWRPISQGGPQRLPTSSGGVTAFKFRDPEGHPLELLQFPADDVPETWQRSSSNGAGLGLDHSAISVADTDRSIAFYESLGFRVSARSHNRGSEQARLDDVEAPDVAVTGLSLAGQAAPHVELLCYRSRPDPVHVTLRATDIAATRIVLAVADPDALADLCARFEAGLVSDGPVAWPDGRTEALLRDPDGHHLLLTAQG